MAAITLERFLKGLGNSDSEVEGSIKRISAIALESDEEFIKKTEVLLLQLPLRLRSDAIKFLQGTKLNETPQIGKLIYIPVMHLRIPLDESSKVNKFRKAFGKVLFKEATTSTLITVGEESAGTFDKKSLDDEKTKRISIWKQFGVLNNTVKADKFFDSYYYAIFDYMERHPSVRVIGADSLIGGAMGATLALLGFSIQEVTDRLTIEARTRYALKQIAKLAKKDQHVIFIQGLLYEPGIEAWCKRNQVSLEVKTPAPFN